MRTSADRFAYLFYKSTLGQICYSFFPKISQIPPCQPGSIRRLTEYGPGNTMDPASPQGYAEASEGRGMNAKTSRRDEDFGVEGEGNKAYTHGMAKKRQRKTGPKDAVKAAAEFGIDIQALKDNLKLSYSERIRRHQIKLNAMKKSGKPIKRPSDKRMLLELEAIREITRRGGKGKR